ncbi:MAG: hypothetical protein OWV35_07505 [Firmicutes bacterium]|nr:hypothetical protein [Bacillota bacterium]
MIFTTYPDGTQELADHGARVRVRQGRVVRVTLDLGVGDPVVLDSAPPAPGSPYAPEERLRLADWVARVTGATPVLTDQGPVWAPPVTVAQRTPRVKAG